MQNQEPIIDIKETLSISYLNQDGISMPVIFSDLEPLFSSHPKIITRIFVPSFTGLKVLGTITQDLEVRELENVKFMGEYPDKEGRKLQVWINKADCEHVRITALTSTISL